MNYEGRGSVHMLAEFKQIQACDLILSTLYASILDVTQSCTNYIPYDAHSYRIQEEILSCLMSNLD